MAAYGQIIIIKSSGKDGSCFPLLTKTCSFGKDPDCDIRIGRDGVASHHCVLEVRVDSKVFLKRLCENSTILNGRPLSTDWIALKHKDIIKISDRSFRWEYLPGSIHIDQDAEKCSSHLINSNKENTPGNKSSVINPAWKSSEKEVTEESSTSCIMEDIGEPKLKVALVECAETAKTEISRRRSKRLGAETVVGHTSVLNLSFGVEDAIENVEQQGSTVELNVKPQKFSSCDYLKSVLTGGKNVNRKSFSDTFMKASAEKKNLYKPHSLINGEDIRKSEQVPNAVAVDLEKQNSARKGPKIKEFFVESFGSNNSLQGIDGSEKLEGNFNCDINEEELFSPKNKKEPLEKTKSSKNIPRAKKKILKTPRKLHTLIKDSDEMNSSDLSENIVEFIQSHNIIDIGNGSARKQIQSKMDVEAVTCPWNETTWVGSQLDGSGHSSSSGEDCEGYKLRVMKDSKTQSQLNLDENSLQTKSILVTPGRRRSSKKQQNDISISNFAEDVKPDSSVKHESLVKSQKSVKLQGRSRLSIRAIRGTTPLKNVETDGSKLVNLDQSNLCNEKLEEEWSCNTPKTLDESISVFLEKLKKTPTLKELKSEENQSARLFRSRRFAKNSVGSRTSLIKNDKEKTSKYGEIVNSFDESIPELLTSSKKSSRDKWSVSSTRVGNKPEKGKINTSCVSSVQHTSGLLQTPNSTEKKPLKPNSLQRFKSRRKSALNNTTSVHYQIPDDKVNYDISDKKENSTSGGTSNKHIPAQFSQKKIHKLSLSGKKTDLYKKLLTSTPKLKSVKKKLNDSSISNSMIDKSELLLTPNDNEEESLINKTLQSLRKHKKTGINTSGPHLKKLIAEMDPKYTLEVDENSITSDTLILNQYLISSHQEHHELLTADKKTPKRRLTSKTPKLFNPGRKTIINTKQEDYSISSSIMEDKINESLVDKSENALRGEDFKDKNSEDTSSHECPEILVEEGLRSCKKRHTQNRTIPSTLEMMKPKKEILDASCTLNAVEDIAGLYQTPREVRDESLKDNSVRSLRKRSLKNTPGHNNSNLERGVESNLDEINISTPLDAIFKFQGFQTNKFSVSQNNTFNDSCTSDHVEDIKDLWKASNINEEESFSQGSVCSLRSRRDTMNSSAIHGKSDQIEVQNQESLQCTNKNTTREDDITREISEETINVTAETNSSCKKTPSGKKSMSSTLEVVQPEKKILDDSCTSSAVEDIADLYLTPHEGRDESLANISVRSLRKRGSSIKVIPGHNVLNSEENKESILEGNDNSSLLDPLAKDMSSRRPHADNPSDLKLGGRTPMMNSPELQTPNITVSQNITLGDSYLTNGVEEMKDLWKTPFINKDESVSQRSMRSLRSRRDVVYSTPVPGHSDQIEDIQATLPDRIENTSQDYDYIRENSRPTLNKGSFEMNSSCKETPSGKKSMSSTLEVMLHQKRLLDDSCTSNAVEDIADLYKTPHESRNESLKGNSVRSLRKRSLKNTPGHNKSNLEEEVNSFLEEINISTPLDALEKDISFQGTHENSKELKDMKKTAKRKFKGSLTTKFSVSQNNTFDDSCTSNHVEDIKDLWKASNINEEESFSQGSVCSLKSRRDTMNSTAIPGKSDQIEDQNQESLLCVNENTTKEDELTQEISEEAINVMAETNSSCKKTPSGKKSMTRTLGVMQPEKKILDDSCTSSAVEDIADLYLTPHEGKDESLANISVRSLRKRRSSIKVISGHSILNSEENKESILEGNDNSSLLDPLAKDMSSRRPHADNPSDLKLGRRTMMNSPELQTPNITVSQNITLGDSYLTNGVEEMKDLWKTPNINKEESVSQRSMRSLRSRRDVVYSTPVPGHSDQIEDIQATLPDRMENTSQDYDYIRENSRPTLNKGSFEMNSSCKETPSGRKSMSSILEVTLHQKQLLDDSCTSNAVEDFANLCKTPHESRDESLKDNSVRSLRKRSLKNTPGHNKSNLEEGVDSFLEEINISTPLNALEKDISFQGTHENSKELKQKKKTAKKKLKSSQTNKFSVSQNNTFDDSCTSNHVEDIKYQWNVSNINEEESFMQESVCSLRSRRDTMNSTAIPGKSDQIEDQNQESLLCVNENTTKEDELTQEISEEAINVMAETNSSCKKTPSGKKSMTRTLGVMQPEKKILDDSCTSSAVEDIADLYLTPHEGKDESLANISVRSLRKRRSSIKVISGHSILNSEENKESILEGNDNSSLLDPLAKDMSSRRPHADNPSDLKLGRRTMMNSPELQTPNITVSQNITLGDSYLTNGVEEMKDLWKTPNINKEESVSQRSMRSLRSRRDVVYSTPVPGHSDQIEDIQATLPDRMENTSQDYDYIRENSRPTLNKGSFEMNSSCKETPSGRKSMSSILEVTLHQKQLLDDSCTSNAVEDFANLCKTPHESRDESLKDNSVRSLRKRSLKNTPGHNKSNLEEGVDSFLEEINISTPLNALEKDISFQGTHENSKELKQKKKTAKKKLKSSQTNKFSVSQNNTFDDSCTSNHVEDIKYQWNVSNINEEESFMQESVCSLRSRRDTMNSTAIPGKSDQIEVQNQESLLCVNENTTKEDELTQEISDEAINVTAETNSFCKKTPSGKKSISSTLEVVQPEKKILDDSCTSSAVEDIADLYLTPHEGRDESLANISVRSLRKRGSSIKVIPGHNILHSEENKESILEDNNNSSLLDPLAKDMSSRRPHADNPSDLKLGGRTPMMNSPELQTPNITVSQNITLGDSYLTNGVEEMKDLWKTPNINKEESITQWSVRSLRSRRDAAYSTPVPGKSDQIEDIQGPLPDRIENTSQDYDYIRENSRPTLNKGSFEMNSSCKKTPSGKKSMSSTLEVMLHQKRLLNDSCTSNAVEDIAGLYKTPREVRDESLKGNSVRSLRKRSLKNTPGHNKSNLEEGVESILEEINISTPLDTLEEDISFQGTHENSKELKQKKKTAKKKLKRSQTNKFSVSQNNTCDDSCTSNHLEDIKDLWKASNINEEESFSQVSVCSLKSRRDTMNSTAIPGKSDQIEDQNQESLLCVNENTTKEDELTQEISDEAINVTAETNSSCMRTPSGRKSMSSTLEVMLPRKQLLDDSCALNAVEDIAGLYQTPREVRDESLKDNSVRSLRRRSLKNTPGHNKSNLEGVESFLEEINISTPLDALEKDISFQGTHENSKELKEMKKTAKRKFKGSLTTKFSVSQNNTCDDSCTSNHVEDIKDLWKASNINEEESFSQGSVCSLKSRRDTMNSTAIPGKSDEIEDQNQESLLCVNENTTKEDELTQEISEEAINVMAETNSSCKKTPSGKKSMTRTLGVMQPEKKILDDSCTSSAVEDIADLYLTPHEGWDESMANISVRSLRKRRSSIKVISGHSILNSEENKESILEGNVNSSLLDPLAKDMSSRRPHADNPSDLKLGRRTPMMNSPELQTPNITVSRNITLGDSYLSIGVEEMKDLWKTPNINKEEAVSQRYVRSLRSRRDAAYSTPVPGHSDQIEDIQAPLPDRIENTSQDYEYIVENSRPTLNKETFEMNSSCKETPSGKKSRSSTLEVMLHQKRLLNDSCTSNAVEDIAGLYKTPREVRDESLKGNSVRSLRKRSLKNTPGHNKSNLEGGVESFLEEINISTPLDALEKDISFQGTHENSKELKEMKKTAKRKFKGSLTTKFSVSQNNTCDDSCTSNHVEDIKDLWKASNINEEESFSQGSVCSLKSRRDTMNSTAIPGKSDEIEDQNQESLLCVNENTTKEDEVTQDISDEAINVTAETNSSCKRTPSGRKSMSSTLEVMLPRKQLLDDSCASNAVEDIAGLYQTPHEVRDESLKDNSVRSLRRRSLKNTPGHNKSNLEGVENFIEEINISTPLDVLEEDISFQGTHENSKKLKQKKKTAKRNFKGSQTNKLSVSQNNTFDDSCTSDHVDDIKYQWKASNINEEESFSQESVCSLRSGRDTMNSTAIPGKSDQIEDQNQESVQCVNENTTKEDEITQEISEEAINVTAEKNSSCKETPSGKKSMSSTLVVMQPEKKILDDSCTLNAVEDIVGLYQMQREARDESFKVNSVRSLRQRRGSLKNIPGHNNSNLLGGEEGILEDINLVDTFEKDISLKFVDEEHPELLNCEVDIVNAPSTNVSSANENLTISSTKDDSQLISDKFCNEVLKLGDKSDTNGGKSSNHISFPLKITSTLPERTLLPVVMLKRLPIGFLESCCTIPASSVNNNTEFERSRTTKNKKLSTIKASEAALVAKSELETKSRGRRKRTTDKTGINESVEGCTAEGERTTRSTRNIKSTLKESEAKLVSKSELATKSSGRRKQPTDKDGVNNSEEVSSASVERTTKSTRNKKSTLKESEVELVSKRRRKQPTDKDDVNNSEVVSSANVERTTRSTRNEKSTLKESEAELVSKRRRKQPTDKDDVNNSEEVSSANVERTTRSNRNENSTLKESEAELVSKSELVTKSNRRRKQPADKDDVNNSEEVSSANVERTTRSTRNEKSTLKESETVLVSKSELVTKSSGRRKQRTNKDDVNNSEEVSSGNVGRTTRSTRNENSTLMESETELVSKSELVTKSNRRRKQPADKDDVNNSEEVSSANVERTTRSTRNEKSTLKESETVLVSKRRRKQPTDKDDVNNSEEVSSANVERTTRSTRNEKSTLKESEAELVSKSELVTKSNRRRKQPADKDVVQNSEEVSSATVVCCLELVTKSSGRRKQRTNKDDVNNSEEVSSGNVERTTRSTRNENSTLKESKAELVSKRRRKQPADKDDVNNSEEVSSANVERTTRSTRNEKSTLKESEAKLISKSELVTKSSRRRKQPTDKDDINNSEEVCSADGEKTTRSTRNKKSTLKESEAKLVSKSELVTKSSGRRKQPTDNDDVNNSEEVCSADGERTTRSTRNKKSTLKESEAKLVSKSESTEKESLGPPAKRSKNSHEDKIVIENVEKLERSSNATEEMTKNNENRSFQDRGKRKVHFENKNEIVVPVKRPCISHKRKSTKM